jgi:hypothetical protein
MDRVFSGGGVYSRSPLRDAERQCEIPETVDVGFNFIAGRDPGDISWENKVYVKFKERVGEPVW